MAQTHKDQCHVIYFKWMKGLFVTTNCFHVVNLFHINGQGSHEIEMDHFDTIVSSMKLCTIEYLQLLLVGAYSMSLFFV